MRAAWSGAVKNKPKTATVSPLPVSDELEAVSNQRISLQLGDGSSVFWADCLATGFLSSLVPLLSKWIASLNPPYARLRCCCSSLHLKQVSTRIRTQLFLLWAILQLFRWHFLGD
ncbi:hypothetical protein V7S43_015638 [Phytophthora oleae]|uniref:Uncharacterized protein n=1 Tax=Phytophthora oleae TaxID=2107226 RepID=A0ABD3EYN0_9STRA